MLARCEQVEQVITILALSLRNLQPARENEAKRHTQETIESTAKEVLSQKTVQLLLPDSSEMVAKLNKKKVYTLFRQKELSLTLNYLKVGLWILGLQAFYFLSALEFGALCCYLSHLHLLP